MSFGLNMDTKISSGKNIKMNKNLPTEKQIKYLKSLYCFFNIVGSIPKTKSEASAKISELLELKENAIANMTDAIYYENDAYWDYIEDG